MFKMCFRTHRTQKIYSQKKKSSTMKNWGLELSSFFDVPKKNRKKNVSLRATTPFKNFFLLLGASIWVFEYFFVSPKNKINKKL